MQNWSGPEDFALNAMRTGRETLVEAAASPSTTQEPSFDFLTKRDEFAREMAAMPCAPLHKITEAQLRDLRDWHGTESAKEEGKSPALAKWHRSAMRQLEEITSQWGGMASH